MQANSFSGTHAASLNLYAPCKTIQAYDWYWRLLVGWDTSQSVNNGYIICFARLKN